MAMARRQQIFHPVLNTDDMLEDDLETEQRALVPGFGSPAPERPENELPNFQQLYAASALESSVAGVTNPIKTGYCALCAAHCMPLDSHARKLEEALLLLKSDLKGAWDLFQHAKGRSGSLFVGMKLTTLKRHLLYHSVAQAPELAEDSVTRQLVSELMSESDSLRTHMMRTVTLNGKKVRVINRAICDQLNTNRKLMLDTLKISSNARSRRNTMRMDVQLSSSSFLSIQAPNASANRSLPPPPVGDEGGPQGTSRIRELP
ncbi:protein ORF76 [Cyprinid herpesvirus 1]|uniref:Protein ORF76 n=1 Tax=Cyprinid herpesvirus 1 TaxID=317858 RepID=K7PBX2_9VIRU|nr:protein ORF76 [Cyprinid herpesvirus 1]AFJ20373.1 protein ORF76 [Cyprinid herpesvirus 1]